MHGCAAASDALPCRSSPVSPSHQLKEFVAAYVPAITALTDRSTCELWAAFEQDTADWTSAAAKTTLVSRFVGFPIWDALLFPTIALSNLPLITPVRASRFSPRDASRLAPPLDQQRGKLPGISTHHSARSSR